MQPHTTIRIGAAHFDMRLSIGDKAHTIDIHALLKGSNLQATHQKLTELSGIVCQFHDIKESFGSKPSRPRRKQQQQAGGGPRLKPLSPTEAHRLYARAAAATIEVMR